MSPTKAARTEKGTKAKVESKEVTRMRQERRDHFTGESNPKQDYIDYRHQPMTLSCTAPLPLLIIDKEFRWVSRMYAVHMSVCLWCAAKLVADMERAAEARHQRALAAKRRVRAKLEADVGFRVLFAAVAHAFADQLRQDLADLQAGKQVISQPLSPASQK